MIVRLFAICVALLSSMTVTAQWITLSETTGNASALCTHQGNMLVMGSGTRIFRSTDLGTTWIRSQIDTPSTQGWGTLDLTSDGVTLYAARGGGKLTKSTDNGVTWAGATTGLPGNANVYAVHAGQGKIFAGLLSGGVYVSANSGQSWFRSDSGMVNRDIRVFASKGDTVFAGATNGDLYRSFNGGALWTNIGPSQYANNELRAIAIIDSIILIGDIGPGFTSGPLRSTNWGDTWAAFSSGLNEATDGRTAGFARIDTTIFTGLYQGPGHGGVFKRSSNTNWINVSTEQMILQSGTPPFYIPAISFATVGTAVFAGMSAYGLYRSTDLGLSWQQVTTDVVGYTEERRALFSVADTLYAGGEASGVFISTDNGSFWNEYRRDLPNSVSGISAFAAIDSFLFVGQLTTGGVARSSNGGKRWQAASSGLGSASITGLAVGIPSTGGHRLFAGTGNGVYVSTDYGTSWSNTTWGAGTVTALAASGNTVLAARQNQLWRSSDLGASWVRDTIGVPTSGTIRALLKAGSRWFAAGVIIPSVLMSEDDGTSWVDVAGPVTFPAQTLAASGDTVYVSNNTSVHFTTNFGQTWTTLSNNLSTMMYVRAMMVKGGYIYIALADGGTGAFRRPVPGVTSVERIARGTPDEVRLDQNFPNPFNPTTTLSFSLPQPDRVSLAIYDILGREVARLVDGILRAGTYSVQWNASGVASGVYFGRLTGSAGTLTRKMIVSR